MPVYAGWQLKVYLGTGSVPASFSGSSTGVVILDGVTSISYDYINNIEGKEECGSRTVKALVEGTIGISGTIERYYTGSGINKYAWSSTLTGSALSSYGIFVCPNGFNNAGNPWEILSDIKFDTRRVNQRPGSNLFTETLGFIATYLQTGSF